MKENEIPIGQKKMRLKDQERIEMKFLSPLTGVFFQKHRRGKKEVIKVQGREMDCRELARYEEVIRETADRVNRPEMEGGNPFDIMDECFDGSSSILEKAEHGTISVENIGGALYGCTTLILKEELEDWEMEEMCGFIAIQYSDGWGEVFEQRNIPADGGILNVYFDYAGSPDFQIQSTVIKNPYPENQKGRISESGQPKIPETEMPCLSEKKPRPKLTMFRHNRHIFSVLPGALQLLLKCGQKKEAEEMYDRVSKVRGYDEALEIISEYVEIEPGSARENADPGGQKKKTGQTKEQGR